MDELTVIGIVHSVGEFNGQPYDNYNIHCVRPGLQDKNEVGQVSSIVKVKASLFVSSPVQVGDTITPYYDRYGRVITIK